MVHGIVVIVLDSELECQPLCWFQEAQLSHIRRSVESERAQKAATEVQRRLLGVKGHLEQLLSMQYGSDSEGLDLAR